MLTLAAIADSSATCHLRTAPPTAPSNSVTVNAPCNCTIVAYLHLRKCGGTAIRSLFQRQRSGWTVPAAGSFRQPRHTKPGSNSNLGGVIASWEAGADGVASCVPSCPGSSTPRWFFEVHTSPGIEIFVEEVARLRRLATTRGCQLISATMLREPSDLARSEFFYEPFHQELDKLGLRLDAWMRSHPELLLLGSTHTSQSKKLTSHLGYRYLGLDPRARRGAASGAVGGEFERAMGEFETAMLSLARAASASISSSVLR